MDVQCDIFAYMRAESVFRCLSVLLSAFFRHFFRPIRSIWNSACVGFRLLIFVHAKSLYTKSVSIQIGGWNILLLAVFALHHFPFRYTFIQMTFLCCCIWRASAPLIYTQRSGVQFYMGVVHIIAPYSYVAYNFGFWLVVWCEVATGRGEICCQQNLSSSLYVYTYCLPKCMMTRFYFIIKPGCLWLVSVLSQSMAAVCVCVRARVCLHVYDLKVCRHKFKLFRMSMPLPVCVCVISSRNFQCCSLLGCHTWFCFKSGAGRFLYKFKYITYYKT